MQPQTYPRYPSLFSLRPAALPVTALLWALLVAMAIGTTGQAQGSPELILESAGVQLFLDSGHLRLERSGVLMAEVQAIEFNFNGPKSITLGMHTADHVSLHAVYPAAVQYGDGSSEQEADIEISRIDGGIRFHAKPVWASNAAVRLRDLDDHFFGVVERLYPNNRHSPDLRGAVMDIDAQGDGSQYHENYASAWSAFYMTTRGYASFFDSFSKGRYRLGVEGETELYHRTGELDWYVLFGRDGDEILRAYYRVIGAPKAPPLWALGPVGWRDENSGAAQVLEDVRHLSEMHIPFTAWWIDRPYSDGANAWSKMNFNAKFVDPGKWVATLARDYDLKLMTWIAPMTFGDHDFPALLPGETSYMDLSAPEARQEFGRRLAVGQYAYGVHGHKMDRGEEYFPEMAHWKDGTGDNEARNKYIYLYAKTTHENLARAWGDDEFNFARAAIHRTQPYLSAVWGGDSRGTWDGLAGNLANAIRCGFMGFPVWGGDTGGYFGGHIDKELYARWLQWAVWEGFFEIKLDNFSGTPPDRVPWAYDEQLQSAFRRACELRMQLLPYIFSLARTSGTHGVLMKPLAYVWPDNPETYAIGDEYLFGPAFLVAPITAPGGQRSVYLPAGNWYEFQGPAAYPGGRTVKLTVPFDRIPVFVRGNSIYVTGAMAIGNQRFWSKGTRPELVIHATPGGVGDNVAFEFVDYLDQNQAKTIRLNRTASGIQITAPALSLNGELEVRCDAAAVATLNGRKVRAVYDGIQHQARIAFASGQPLDCRIEWEGRP